MEPGTESKTVFSFGEPVSATLMRGNSRPAGLKSTQAFMSEVTCWRSERLVKLSQGGGILTMYGLILGHVLWKDFAQLRDEEALEFLSVIKTKKTYLGTFFQKVDPPNTEQRNSVRGNKVLAKEILL